MYNVGIEYVFRPYIKKYKKLYDTTGYPGQTEAGSIISYELWPDTNLGTSIFIIAVIVDSSGEFKQA